MIFIRSLALCFLAVLLVACPEGHSEIAGLNKTGIFQHNYIAMATSDGTPAEFEISYSVLGQNGANEVKTEKRYTPCLIGGENVLATYDSILNIFSKKTAETLLALNRNFREEGADFLSIRNLSFSVIEYAVIGNQSLTFRHPSSLDNLYNFSNNIDEKDKGKVVRISPTPIHHDGVPVLYLLKPELAGMDSYYVISNIGPCDGGEVELIAGTYAKRIEIGTTTYNIREVLDFYRKEYEVGNQLFSNYQDYDSKCPKYRGLFHLSTKLPMKIYGEIQPYQLLKNSGQIWFINTNSGMKGVDIFKYSNHSKEFEEW